MIGRWLLRLVLVVTAFIVGNVGSFFLLILVTWDQELIDLFGVIAGVALAAFTFVKSQPITRSKLGRAS
ncbi:MAG TPA: hypothetical protein VE174_14140 [Actinomycetota bacterium]|nr:hypothetical protein [Actinomycetota bacterium]